MGFSMPSKKNQNRDNDNRYHIIGIRNCLLMLVRTIILLAKKGKLLTLLIMFPFFSRLKSEATY